MTGGLENFTPAERTFANEMRDLGNRVEIIPRAEGIRTPDLMINGTQYELKTVSGVQRTDPEGLSSAISSRIMDGRGQAGDIIVDARQQDGMSRDIGERAIGRAYGADREKRLQSIIIMTPNGVIHAPRRN